MNSCHKARLLVLDVIVRCSRTTTPSLEDTEIDSSIWEEIRELTLEIVASIPYHLADSLESFLDQALTPDGMKKAIFPGKPVGGLLVMHTLDMVLMLSVVDPIVKVYVKD